MDFSGIGGSIVTGALSAIVAMITHIPLMIWLILAVGIVAFGVLMRYLTNIKVDLVIVVGFVVVATIIYYREHWIEMGRAEDQAQVEAANAKVAAYQKTNGLIEACYAKNTNASFLWDRTQGKCLRADGAVE